MELSERALRWLGGIPPDEPFFLYLHYLDGHRPYPALTRDEVEAAQARVASGAGPASEKQRAEMQYAE